MADITIKVPRLYVIGDRGVFRSDEDWLESLDKVATALIGLDGVLLQIRVKGSSPQSCFKRMQEARKVVDGPMAQGVPVLLNGTVEEARHLNYTGAHLPEEAIPDEPISRPGIPIAASVHSLAAAERAARAGALFALYGPVFRPGSKQRDPVGIEALETVSQAAPLPLLALGGITPERVDACINAGAAGVAGITRIMKSKNPKHAIGKFMSALKSQT